MSTPSASNEDRVEQDTPLVRPAQDDVQVPLEASAPDAVEQAADADPSEPTEPAAPSDVPLEADPADAVEQSAVVELDEDERR